MKKRVPLHRRVFWKIVFAVETVIAATAWWLVNSLPARHAYGLGNAMGWLVRRGVKHRSLIAMKNLLGQTSRSDATWAALWKQYMRHYGAAMVDWIRFERMTDEELLQRTLLEGEEHLQRALRGARGVALFMNHIGNPVCLGVALCLRGYDLTGVRNAAPIPFLERKAVRLFQRLRVNQVLIGDGVPARASSVFRRNGLMAFSSDYSVSDRHTWRVPLGRAELQTSIGAALLALRYHAPVICATIVRLPDNKYRITLHPPLSLTPTGDIFRDAVTLTQRAIHILDRDLHAHPDQWLIWNYAPIHPPTGSPAPVSSGAMVDLESDVEESASVLSVQ